MIIDSDEQATVDWDEGKETCSLTKKEMGGFWNCF